MVLFVTINKPCNCRQLGHILSGTRGLYQIQNSSVADKSSDVARGSDAWTDATHKDFHQLNCYLKTNLKWFWNRNKGNVIKLWNFNQCFGLCFWKYFHVLEFCNFKSICLCHNDQHVHVHGLLTCKNCPKNDRRTWPTSTQPSHVQNRPKRD